VPDLLFALPRLSEVYDLDNPWSRDADFYLALVDAPHSKVLDLGCGTGTLACALAGAGHDVTGVDPAAAMLAVARAKPHAEQAQWIEAPAQHFESAARFDWVMMTGHTLQAFLTDLDLVAVFGTMRRHLREGGRAAFETRNPDLDWAGEWAAQGQTERVLPTGRLLRSLKIIAKRDELISFEQRYGFEDTNLQSISTLRFPTLALITRLLADAGLRVRELYGDWNRTPFDPRSSREMIFIAGPTTSKDLEPLTLRHSSASDRKPQT
jgi:SAM-dependent methyltransferase